ncbi:MULTISPECIES: sulfite exporter TauE/SafE family protein [unclassified Pseudodesulfovibrio]|uniref:sulfite exporter TauE/SafE family protein n=1 Tax=unclassified Pseudodesulfovibrio TaxID=2661612 RepID=UPI000FEB6E40|nr:MULTISPECIES: sulfite exporter TauE/SafE family protein [unclassified Pseudodesulfovibrio]MCJ2165825.1 sulfite exporter TauE/SafE family protein [Pseudodesulfovibrio sp. S3-i]RWU02745.1 sulfite exporter TauE/SafE family protein [Pseudodesulfovibrio sp. S3]
MITTYLLYIVLGAFAGILAGLLGIGGGLVIVPMLNITFELQSFPVQHIQHIALGTSMATIIFTSLSSMRAHHKRGAINYAVFWRLTPGIITGTFLGAWVASLLSTMFLKVFFGLFLYYVASKMLMKSKAKSTRELPGYLGIFGAGNGIGIFSALVGIGGGTLTVPFLSWCNQTMHVAIATAAAVGLPIALAGTAGYVINGWGVEGIPGPHVGYVYLPAFLGIICMSVVTAPLGAKLAHSLPVDKLKKIFAVLLLIVGTKMLWSALV